MRTLLIVLALVGCNAVPAEPAGGSGSATPVERTTVVVSDGGVDDAAPIESKTWSVHFSPSGGCQDAIVQLIGSAKTSVRVMTYSFTSAPIANALATASLQGRDVQVVADNSDPTEKNDKLANLKTAHVPVFLDGKHAIMHDKVIIVDERIVETGSYNFSVAAETRNAENCLILHNKSVAAAYLDNWTLHQSHSTAY